MIFADAASGEPVRPEVAAAMGEHLKVANPASIHEAGLAANRTLTECRGIIGELLGLNTNGSLLNPRFGPENNRLVFTPGGTWSNNLLIIGLLNSLLEASSLKLGLVVGAVEHSSVLQPAKFISDNPRVGLVQASCDKTGKISAESVRDALELLKFRGFKPALVCVQMANNEVGTIQPIAEISEVAHIYGAYFHCDAVAGGYSEDLNMDTFGIDSMSLSPHKVGGPRGVGVLAVRKNVPSLKPLVFGGSQEGGLSPGTTDVASVVGATVALALATQERIKNTNSLLAVRNKFLQSVLDGSLPIVLTGPESLSASARLPGIASLLLMDRTSESVLADLSNAGIYASAGAACGAGKNEGSHVLAAMGYGATAAVQGLRFSFLSTATTGEAEECATALRTVLS